MSRATTLARLWTCGLLALAMTLAPIGCALSDPTAICELGSTDFRVFPMDGSTAVPTNVRVRILLDGVRAADIDPLVVVDSDRQPVAATVVETATDFGAVLEVIPQFDLPSNTEFTVELVERDTGVPAKVTRFTTGAFSEQGPPTDSGPVVIGALGRGDRDCCGSTGCRDGSVVKTPPLVSEAFQPQLVLLDVREVFNSHCGPTSSLVGVIPVLQENAVRHELRAETDLALSGCFRVLVRDQLGREGEPDGVVCTEGFTWRPQEPNQECSRTSGCAAGAGPTNTPPLALLAAGLLAFLWRRRSA